jgi:hypothetical protein
MRSACVNGYQDGVLLQHVLRVLLAAALGSLPLGGCAEKPDNLVLQPDIASAAADMPHQPVIDSTAQPLLPSVHRSRSKPVARVASEKFVRKAARLDPNTLVGLSPDAIDRILGSPTGVRAEAMMVEWTYARPSCSLIVFFYPDIVTGTLRALNYTLADMNGRAGANRVCVDFLMMARSDEPN